MIYSSDLLLCCWAAHQSGSYRYWWFQTNEGTKKGCVTQLHTSLCILLSCLDFLNSLLRRNVAVLLVFTTKDLKDSIQWYTTPVDLIYSHFAAFELSLNFMICLNQDDLRSHPISYKPTVFWWGAFKRQKSSSAVWQLLCWLTGVTCTKLTSLLETLAMFNMAIVHWYRICIIKYIYKENTSACAYVQFCGRNCWYTLHSHIWATCSTWEKRSKFITAIWTLRAYAF